MNVKKLTATLLSVCMAFSFAACNNKTKNTDKKEESKVEEKKTPEIKKKDGGTFVFTSDSDPLTLNPLLMGDQSSHMVNHAIFSPLFLEDGDKIEYLLAKDLKISDDLLTYTLTLKDGLKWHDEQKLTADDVVFTVKTILDKKQNVESRNLFIVDNKEVQIVKKDDLTIQFKLPKPFVPFKSALSDLKPIPKHIFEKEKDIAKAKASTSEPIGSGPFKFKEWKKGEMLTLEKFDNYFGGKPNFDKVVFRVISDGNAANTAFENGEITAKYINDENYKKFKDNNKFKTFAYPEGMTYYMALNIKNPILAKKEVRQAIFYALNKDEIIKSYSDENLTQKAYSVFPPQTHYYTEDLEKYDYNLDKAKELMKKAGVEKAELKFLYPEGGSIAKNITQVVQAQLKKIGIDVQTISIDSNTFYQKIMGQKERDFDLTLNGYVFGNEPNTYRSAFYTNSKFNASNYSNKELDKLFDDGANEQNPSKRKEIYEKIQKIIADDAFVYTIDYPTSKLITQKNLDGIKESKLVPTYMFQDLSKLYFTE